MLTELEERADIEAENARVALLPPFDNAFDGLENAAPDAGALAYVAAAVACAAEGFTRSR